MTKFVLFLFLNTSYSGTSYVAEFTSKEACENAALVMFKVLKDYSGRYGFYGCVEK